MPEPIEVVRDRITMYSPFPWRVTLWDGRVVDMLYHPWKRGAEIRIDGGPWVAKGWSDQRCPRVNPDGYIYRVGGNEVVREPVEGGAAELIARIADIGKSGIGGGEAGFAPNTVHLPLRAGLDAGVLNIRTAEFWLQGMGAAIDHVHAGDWDHAVARTGRGTFLIGPNGERHKLFDGQGHGGLCSAFGEPCYLVTDSNFPASDRSGWGLGNDHHVLVVGMHTRKLHRAIVVNPAGTQWDGVHIAGAGPRVAISRERSAGRIGVFDVETGETILDWTNVAPITDYESQTKVSLSPEGRYAAATAGRATNIYDLGSEGQGEPDEPDEPEGPTMSDLDNRKDALDTAQPPISYTEEPFSVQAGTKLTITEPDGNRIVEVYDDNGDLIRME